MLTAYTLRKQAADERARTNEDVARAPDPAPAVAPDPAPARELTIEELQAALERANDELTAVRDELTRAAAMFDALPEKMAAQIEETVAERMATAKAEHEAQLGEAQKTIAALELQVADRERETREHEALKAELGKQLDAALARIAELEAPASETAPTDDAAPVAESAPNRRRR